MSSRHLRIAIIGAGPGGLCMGKRLLDEGFEDFVIIERADEVGGTWYANRYPGCECDTPSLLYSFSFDNNIDRSNYYNTQPEILDYLRDLAEEHGLRSHCKFGHAVTHAKWSDMTSSWKLTLDSGVTVEADVVISAIGMFNQPRLPKIDGIDTFKGTTMHTAEWNSEHDFSRDRVAVIGSAASAVQLVPELVKIAKQVYLFQRTAHWVIPKNDDLYAQKQDIPLPENPKLLNAIRNTMEHEINDFLTFSDPKKLAEFEASVFKAIDEVRDPEVRRKLRPTHPFGSRNTLLSNVYYPAFNETNSELVTEQITHINEHSIVTNDGKERAVDTIIFATGFDSTKLLSAIDVIGRNGQSLSKTWDTSLLAYLGIMISGFPNLFMIFGPNTHVGSVVSIIEAQVEYILSHLHRMVDGGVASVDVKPQVMLRYDSQVQTVLGDKYSWMTDSSSKRTVRIDTTCPFPITEYRRLTTLIDPNAFYMTNRKLI